MVLALTLVLVPLSARGQDLMADPRVQTSLDFLRTWLEAQRDYDQIPGMSASIVHDQRTLWSGGFGYADLARKAPADAKTIYSVCSISKLFTSIGVLQLRDQGKLRLDDPVGKHLAWFGGMKRADVDAPEITIEGLLTHSAGLQRESDHPYWSGPDFAFPTREQMIATLSRQETLYPASTYFQYSNLGISLAGEVVASASGENFDQYVRRAILTPLGMTSTTSDMPVHERGRRLAQGYSSISRTGTREPVTFFSARGIAPAAGFASSADDLSRFASWQFRALAKGSSTEVLRGNTLREMQRVHWVDPEFETTWGLGFAVWRTDDKTFVGHGGSCPGFRAQLLLRPQEKIASVFMANAQGVNTGLYARRMYEIMSPAIIAASKDSGSKAKPRDPALAPYLGTYASGFSDENVVVRWEDGLAVVGFPTTDPVRSLTKLRKTGEHTFRRVLRDGNLGEPLVFEMNGEGKATNIRWFSNNYRRTR